MDNTNTTTLNIKHKLSKQKIIWESIKSNEKNHLPISKNTNEPELILLYNKKI